MPDEMSLELSWEDIKRIVCELGFEILVRTFVRKANNLFPFY